MVQELSINITGVNTLYIAFNRISKPGYKDNYVACNLPEGVKPELKMKLEDKEAINIEFLEIKGKQLQ